MRRMKNLEITVVFLCAWFGCPGPRGSGCELWPICQGDAWGYVDKSGTVVVKPVYRGVGWYSEGLAPATLGLGEPWGYIDARGEWAIRPCFESAGDFSESLAAVQSGSLYGFVDRSGAWVIAAQFRNADHFRFGIAPVEVWEDGVRAWCYIDRTGSIVGSRSLEEAWPLQEERGLFRRQGRCGFVDSRGAEVIDAQYDDAQRFSEGLAAVNIGAVGPFGGKWGYIDRNGRTVIAPRFDAVSPFLEGLAAVNEGGRLSVREGGFVGGTWSFIDKSGDLALCGQWADAGAFSEGLAPARAEGGRWGFITERGDWAIPPWFSGAGRFIYRASGSVGTASRGDWDSRLRSSAGPRRR